MPPRNPPMCCAIAGMAAKARMADKRSVRASRIATSLFARFTRALFAYTGQPIPRISAHFYRILGIPSGDAPTSRAREFLEEIDVVGTLRRLAHAAVDLMRVLADEDAPAVSLDAVEDDLGRFRSAGRRLLGKAPLALGDGLADIVVRESRVIAARRGDARAGIRDLLLRHRVGLAAALDLARIQRDRGADMARHYDRAFDMRRVEAQIRDQRLGKALDREFGGRIGSVRDA